MKIPRFRFSLRAVLLLMTLTSCIVGWYFSKTRRAMRQSFAVERIRQLGGNAQFDYQRDSAQRNLGPPLPPPALRWLTGDVVMSDVTLVSMHAPLASDGDLDVLSDLPELTDLRLAMRGLTDTGIQPVESLTQLRRLDLRCSQLTDRAMAHLARLKQLRKLDLYSTQVTDDGLIHLRNLSNLEELKLRGTLVTARGARSLQEALPGCRILGVEGWPDSPALGSDE